MKKITCFILIIFTVVAGDAQDKRFDRHYKRIDSLKLLIQKEKKDTAKIRKLVLLGEVYVRMKNDSALVFFQDAIRLSEKIGFKQGEIHARSSMAFFQFYVKLDYATALELLLYNLKLEEQTGDTTYIFSDTRDVSLIYSGIEDYEKELEYIKKLQNLTNSGLFKDSATLSQFRIDVNNRLGAVYGKLNILDSAKYYKLKVFHYGVAQKDPFRIALGSYGLATIYKKQKNYDSAFYYCRISIPAALKQPGMYRNALIEMKGQR